MARTTQQKFIAALEDLASAHDGLEAVTNRNYSNGVEYFTVLYQPEDGFDSVLQVSVWWGHYAGTRVSTNNSPPSKSNVHWKQNLLRSIRGDDRRTNNWDEVIATIKAELGEALTEVAA